MRAPHIRQQEAWRCSGRFWRCPHRERRRSSLSRHPPLVYSVHQQVIRPMIEAKRDAPGRPAPSRTPGAIECRRAVFARRAGTTSNTAESELMRARGRFHEERTSGRPACSRFAQVSLRFCSSDSSTASAGRAGQTPCAQGYRNGRTRNSSSRNVQYSTKIGCVALGPASASAPSFAFCHVRLMFVDSRNRRSQKPGTGSRSFVENAEESAGEERGRHVAAAREGDREGSGATVRARKA